jgi:signal transduction histidine kinase
LSAPGAEPVTEARDRLSRLSATDRFFAGLRLAAIGVGAVWLLLTPHPEHLRQLAGLFLAFLLYTAFIYSLLFLTAWPIRRLYAAALLADLFFLSGMVRWTGGIHSVFGLGYYLLVGLHAFYFGRKAGIVIATSAATLQVLSEPGTFRAEVWADSAIRIGFLYVIGWSIGELADGEKQARRRTEELLLQLQNTTQILEHAQKMALIGRLTAGIAHEINNPAAVILTRIERMLLEAEETSLSDRLRRDLGTLAAHAQRIAGVVQKLLAYSRPGSTEFTALDINAVIQQSIPLIEHRLEACHLTLNLNLLRHLPKIYGSANRLEEVFVNLLSNAIDASSPGGQIYVVSTISGGRQKEIQVFVSDAGEGIPQENIDKVFEPFFTTKPPGHGTGLGLYVAYQILKDHGAAISVDSQVGKGTTITVSLPLLEAAFSRSPAATAGQK